MSTNDMKAGYRVTPFGLLTAEEHEAMMAPSIFTPQELEDAALDLEVERVERALAYERAREQVQASRHSLHSAIQTLQVRRISHIGTVDVMPLLAALEELERLEGVGGAA